MPDGEGVVMGCPTVFQLDTDEGRLVGAHISYWRDEDAYGAGTIGRARLSFSPQVARELAQALLREAEKIEKGDTRDPIHGLSPGRSNLRSSLSEGDAAMTYRNLHGRDTPMSEEIAIRYDLPAALQKWDSVEKVRTGDIRRGGYVSEGTLAECVREFMSKPLGERSLYEIQTEEQPGLSTTILGPAAIVQIAQRPDFPVQTQLIQ